MVSDTFRLELLKRRAAGVKVYEIARQANVRANELSGIAAGSITVRRGDARVERVAAVLCLTVDEAFTDEVADHAPAPGVEHAPVEAT
jgi:hypothetical protein